MGCRGADISLAARCQGEIIHGPDLGLRGRPGSPHSWSRWLRKTKEFRIGECPGCGPRPKSATDRVATRPPIEPRKKIVSSVWAEQPTSAVAALAAKASEIARRAPAKVMTCWRPELSALRLSSSRSTPRNTSAKRAALTSVCGLGLDIAKGQENGHESVMTHGVLRQKLPRRPPVPGIAYKPVNRSLLKSSSMGQGLPQRRPALGGRAVDFRIRRKTGDLADLAVGVASGDQAQGAALRRASGRRAWLGSPALARGVARGRCAPEGIDSAEKPRPSESMVVSCPALRSRRWTR